MMRACHRCLLCLPLHSMWGWGIRGRAMNHLCITHNVRQRSQQSCQGEEKQKSWQRRQSEAPRFEQTSPQSLFSVWMSTEVTKHPVQKYTRTTDTSVFAFCFISNESLHFESSVHVYKTLCWSLTKTGMKCCCVTQIWVFSNQNWFLTDKLQMPVKKKIQILWWQGNKIFILRKLARSSWQWSFFHC